MRDSPAATRSTTRRSSSTAPTARYIDSHDIDSVILGCTELPLVISGDDLPIEVLDTTVIHATAILEAAA